MNGSALVDAQRAREERVWEDRFDLFFNEQITVLFSAEDVSPDERAHLRGILKHYAKMPHPFRACVRDNMKRFGPGRTERVCATLKDIIRGTTQWRNHDGVHASAPELTPEVEKLLLSIPDEKLENLMEVSA